MSNQPFKPKGERAEWRLIYDRLLAHADFGHVIKIEELDEILGRSFIDNRSPIYKARDYLGAMRHRWLEAIPAVGYRVIEASEHMRAALDRKKRAQRQLRTMVRIGEFTDLAKLTPEQLVQFDNQSRFNRLAYMTLMFHESRLARVEAVLQADGKL